MSVTVKDSITLLPVEAELFETLLAAAAAAETGTVLRCAGGWVRDKLLGKQSLDIDVALDNVMGRDFAEKVNAWLTSQGKATRTTAVIHSNPEQSKHLETARMKINDLWIDLVNLRSETYAEGSRIPTMEFGTPEQDALRRDFTINSMFYNINAGVVEDFTGQGLVDLRAGIIRTPLPPRETFMDDPLRVLRAVRFATRFGFELEETLMEAASSEQVRTALGQKVSRERVGTELDGMFNGPSPLQSMRVLHQLQLFPVVFTLPSEVAQHLGPRVGDACVGCLEAADKLLQDMKVELDKEERRFFLLAALLLPLRHVKAPSAKGKPQSAATFIVRESIKWRAKDAEVAGLLHEVATELLGVQQSLRAAGQDSAPEDVRVKMGQCIRKLKQHWRLGALLAPLLTCRSAAPLGVEEAAADSATASPRTDANDMAEEPSALRREMCGELLSSVEAFQLVDCWKWKPLLDGKQVMAALELKKAGPELGVLVNSAVDWQLAHPQGTAEQCLAYLRSKQA